MVKIYEIRIETGTGAAKLRELGAETSVFGAAATRTTGAVSGLNNMFTRLAERMAFVGLVYGGLREIKSGYELFTNQALAVEKLTTVYNDNSKYTLENLDNLKKYAIAEEGVTGVFREQVNAMETSLLAHHDIRISYEKIIPAIIDYAAATGTSATLATQQFSRVLGNPLMAMRLLRQAHIDITKSQQKWMTSLYESGHYVEYQNYLVQQLGERYKGAAADILAHNPGLQLELQFRQASAELGKLGSEILVDALPALKSFLVEVQHGIQWVEAHKEQVEVWGKRIIYVTGGLIGLKIAIGTVRGVLNLWNEGLVITNTLLGLNATGAAGAAVSTKGLAVAEGEATVAATELTAAFDAIPYLDVIAVIATLAGGYALLTDNTKNAGDELQDFIDKNKGINIIKDNIYNTGDAVKDLTADIVKLDDTNNAIIAKEKDKAAIQLAPGIKMWKDFNMGETQADKDSILHNKEQEWREMVHIEAIQAHEKENSFFTQIGGTPAASWKQITNNIIPKKEEPLSDVPKSEDMKSEGHIINTWNIKTFGIENLKIESTDGKIMNKREIYDTFMEILTAAQRDAQISS